MASVQVIAQQGDAIFQKFMEAEPTIAAVASAIIPGAAPVVALVQPEFLVLAPIIDNALKAIAGSADTSTAIGAGASAVLQLIMHLTAGLPNASALSPAAAPSPSAAPPAWTQSASTQGSG